MEKRIDADLSEETKALKESIEKVKVEINLSEGVEKDIKARYVGWNTMRAPIEIKKHIFELMGEGPIRIDSWENKNQVRSAAKSAGLMLVRNKRKGTYGLINPKLKTGDDDSFVFNPDLLDMIDENESDQDEKDQAEKST